MVGGRLVGLCVCVFDGGLWVANTCVAGCCYPALLQLLVFYRIFVTAGFSTCIIFRL